MALNKVLPSTIVSDNIIAMKSEKCRRDIAATGVVLAIVSALMSCARSRGMLPQPVSTTLGEPPPTLPSQLVSTIPSEEGLEQESGEVWIEYFRWEDSAHNYVYIPIQGEAHYISFNSDYKRILLLRSGRFSEEVVSALFSIIQQEDFFVLRGCVEGELLFYEGTLVKVVVKSKGETNMAFGPICDFPDQFGEAVDAIREEIDVLPAEETGSSFIVAEVVEKDRARSIERRGKYRFVTVDNYTLEQQPFLREAIGSPGRFIAIPESTESTIKDYQEQSQSGSSFFIALSRERFFQVTEFSKEERDD